MATAIVILRVAAIGYHWSGIRVIVDIEVLRPPESNYPGGREIWEPFPCPSTSRRVVVRASPSPLAVRLGRESG